MYFYYLVDAVKQTGCVYFCEGTAVDLSEGDNFSNGSGTGVAHGLTDFKFAHICVYLRRVSG